MRTERKSFDQLSLLISDVSEFTQLIWQIMTATVDVRSEFSVISDVIVCLLSSWLMRSVESSLLRLGVEWFLLSGGEIYHFNNNYSCYIGLQYIFMVHFELLFWYYDRHDIAMCALYPISYHQFKLREGNAEGTTLSSHCCRLQWGVVQLLVTKQTRCKKPRSLAAGGKALLKWRQPENGMCVWR